LYSLSTCSMPSTTTPNGAKPYSSRFTPEAEAEAGVPSLSTMLTYT